MMGGSDDGGGVDLPPEVASDDDGGVALPPEVASDDDGGALPPEVSPGLPPDVGGICSCKSSLRKKRCPEQFEVAYIDNLRMKQLNLKEEERRKAAFLSVQHQVCDADGNMTLGNTKWTLEGKHVCRTFWEHAHALGHGTVDSMKTLIRNGALELPVQISRMPAATSRLQFQKADAWFLMVHQDLGEPLAEADPLLARQDENELLEDAGHPLWALALNIGDQKYVPKHYLNPGCFEDIWVMYEAMNPC